MLGRAPEIMLARAVEQEADALTQTRFDEVSLEQRRNRLRFLSTAGHSYLDAGFETQALRVWRTEANGWLELGEPIDAACALRFCGNARYAAQVRLLWAPPAQAPSHASAPTGLLRRDQGLQAREGTRG